jgi:putative nucleotidyltransferase with HDIG domain
MMKYASAKRRWRRHATDFRSTALSEEGGTDAAAIWLMLVSIVPILLWSATNAPHVSQTLASLLAAAALLEVGAPDAVRFGRRVVGPAFCVVVAGYVLYGTPVAVLIGCVRGIVRALTRPSTHLGTAQGICWAILAPLFSGLAASATVGHSLSTAGAAVFTAMAFGLEIAASLLRFAGPVGTASADGWRGFFPWSPFQYLAYGIVGFMAAGELSQGHLAVLLFFAAPFAIARASLGASGWGTERYVAALERENDALLNKMGQFDRANGDLIEALAVAIDEHQGLERGHTRRISQIASRMASALGMSGWNLEILRRAALLHDVGMLALPPGERGPAHCELGSRLVARWRDGRTIAQVIEQHHEHVDGSGYPRGLVGDQIVLEARIVAVAEAFVRMTSGPAAMATLEALNEINARAGSEFDAQAVETLAASVEPRTADVLPMTRRKL